MKNPSGTSLLKPTSAISKSNDFTSSQDVITESKLKSKEKTSQYKPLVNTDNSQKELLLVDLQNPEKYKVN